jgi:hypothetical protein
LITGKLYDYLKYLAQIVLPALGTLYFGLAGIWDLPSAQEVVGTIVVVDTFLGVLLGISQNNYNKSDARFDGAINVAESEERKTFSLDLKGDPEEIEGKDQLVFKVNKP